MDTKKNFLLISPKNRTAYNFRGELIQDILKQGYQVYVTGPNLIDVERIEALGATFVLLPSNKNGVSMSEDLRYTYKLWRLMRKLKIEATLGYTIKPVIYGSIAARLAGVKHISAMVTGVGYLFINQSRKAKLLKKLVTFLYRFGLGCADHVIFQNEDDQAEFVNHGMVRRKKTHVVNGSGVNMQRFAQAPLPEQTTFFMLSRIMYAKGVMEYAEAALKLKERHPDTRFMLLGAFEHIQDSIPEEQFRKKYIDTGVLDYFGESDNIPSYYAQCSVYVLPSYREGTPRTVLEAMAMGRAVVTTDTPGCRQTVIDGKTGYLVPTQDVDSLADSMQQFIHQKELASTMGEASRAYCFEKYRVEVVNQQMLQVMFSK